MHLKGDKQYGFNTMLDADTFCPSIVLDDV